MKKKDFVRLVLGVVGALLFSVGLCMCLLPEWNAFREGVAVTAVGGAVLLILAALAVLLGVFPNPLTDYITALVHTAV